MRIPRIYTDLDLQPSLTTDSPITLNEQASHYIAQVLRLRPGAEAKLFNNTGCEYSAKLTEVSKRQVSARLIDCVEISLESPLHITLLQGISRGERMDYTLQKATELGVNAIAPITTERCGVQLDHKRRAKRMEHWQGVVISACEQCGRNQLPAVQAVTSLTQCFDQAKDKTALRLVLNPDTKQGLSKTIQQYAAMGQSNTAMMLLVGPEGGFSDNEICLAERHGFISVSLGPRVLRTETAGLAALAALQTICGDF